MIILGLGSNIGDRLANLRQALMALRDMPGLQIKQVSPIYISDALLPENAPSDWDLPYLNAAIHCETRLSPEDLLPKLKAVETAIGHKPKIRHWGPRIIDIDILACDDLNIQSERLTLPQANLTERPFALWPLADVAPLWIDPRLGPDTGKTAAQLVEKWGSRYTGDAPYQTRQINHRIDTPELVGVVNVTPDSFSDGGQFQTLDQVIEHAMQLVEGGATVLDIGGESTAPRSKSIRPKDEWQRLAPVLETLNAVKKDFLIPPKISIDTRHIEVARLSSQFSIDWINDVSGLDDRSFRQLIIDSNLTAVLMHHLHIPERRDQSLPRTMDPVKTVYQWLEARLKTLLEFGVSSKQLILDPGIGFGKAAEQSLILVKEVEAFAALHVPILIGHSRKSFMSLFSNQTPRERDLETTIMSLYLGQKPIQYLRVHDPNLCSRAFRTASMLSMC